MLIETSGICDLGCSLGTGRGSTWGRWQRGEPQGWGRPGRLDTDSTSSHLSGFPSRGAALRFEGGGGGLMHHLRPLISSFWSHNASWKVPQTGSYSWSKERGSNRVLFMVQRHDWLTTPNWGISQVTAAWHSCPGEERRPGWGGGGGGSC